MLFTLVLKADEIKTLFQSVDSMSFRTSLARNTYQGYFLTEEFLGLIVVPIAATLLVLYTTYYVKFPIFTALLCACRQEGEQCLESMVFQQEWWNDYWSRVLPAAIHQIDGLRAQGG